MPTEMRRKRAVLLLTLRFLGVLFCILLLAFGVLCAFAANWYTTVYGTKTGFSAIVNTLFGPMEHVEQGLIDSFVLYAAIPALICVVLLCAFLFLRTKRHLILRVGKKFHCRLYPFSRKFSVCVALLLAACTVVSSALAVDMPAYLRAISTRTTFLEDHYVDPETTSILFPEQKRNLILIYLESMETTFLSEELGGGNDVDVIPELYDLALNNVNFSSTDSVGGFRTLSSSDWTIAALVSITSGVPLKESTLDDSVSFLPGLATLSDILHQNGYYQTLMVGSDGDFAGRKPYYLNHGTDRVYDLYTAYADGIVPEGYFVWWGMEDAYLFQYARQELVKIAAQNQPFAFSLLTVDTHHVGGCVCDLCENEYPEQYENVLACSSRQVAAFVDWLRQQDFYEDTTIILMGDHCSMDAEYIERNIPEAYDRRVYNCFINPVPTAENCKERDFCSLDMFPTILSAIGCSIEGDRLGLGTDLFSPTPTLCEELGADRLDVELSNYSDFFVREFL